MDISQYLEIFIEESQEHLQSLNQSLLGLESNPDDVKLLNEIFRVAHTIKGMAGTMGFTTMMSLTHEMENVLDSLRNGEIKVNSHMIDILFECLDYLETSIDSISNSGKEPETGINHLKDKLKSLNEDNSSNKKSKDGNKDEESQKDNYIEDFSFNQYDEELVRKALKEGMRVYKIKIVLAKGCMLKSARAFIVFKTLEEYSEIFKSSPKVEDIEDEKFDREFKVAVVASEDKNVIIKDIESISEIEDIVIEEVIDSNEGAKDVEEIAVADIDNEELTDKTDYYHDLSIKKPKVGKTVRVDINRLDNLMNLVSELIIIKTRLEGIEIESGDLNMTEAVEYLERITTSLHDAVMKVRMVPIERVFNRFPRMVRDLSKELGKEIALTMTGEETELDRTVIDEIGDPLIHLIRNSIDHGIESKEERVKINKSIDGKLFLKAYQDGNSVVIEVEDDGKGINTNKIKNKIIDTGLVTKSEADELNNNEIIDFLFKPGFSTSASVSDLSGRGVGLDVVKTKIESLGGNVEVESIINCGSKFIIRLPLTLAIIQALLVNLGTEKYAIPLNSIKEITSIKAENIKNVQGQEVLLYRENVLPIIRLANILDVKNHNEQQEYITLVVVKKGEKNSGLVVDSLIGQHEIVIKSLGKYLGNIKAIAGATILGDGQVALIIDTNSII